MSILGAALLDVVIALVVLTSGILSWLRGLAEELVTILAWVLSLAVAIQFADYGAQFVPDALNEINLGARAYDLTEFHVPIAGIVLFLTTFILVSQLHRIFTRVTEGKVMQRGDRVMGFLFGLVRGTFLILVLVLIAGTTAIPQADFWHESRLIPYFVDVGRQIIEWMPEEWQALFHYPPFSEASPE